MGKYYKFQKPGRTMFWAFILSFVTLLPGSDKILIEVIIRVSQGDDSISKMYFIAVPILFAIFVVSMFLKKNHPRTIAIFGNTVMVLLICGSMPLFTNAIVELLGNLVIDSDAVIDSLINGEEFGMRTVITGGIAILLFLISFRLVSKIRKSFADCEPETDSVILTLWGTIIAIHIAAIVLVIPSFFSDPPVFIGSSIYTSLFALLKYVFPILLIIKLVFSVIKTIKEFKLKNRRNIFGIKEAAVILIFGFSLFPLFGHFVDQGLNNRPNSVFNTNWSGNSQFKELVESMGYETYSVQSSITAILALNRSICMVLFGPTSFYNPLSEIPYFLDLLSNPDIDTSFLICDDHGSTTTFLLQMALISMATPKHIGPVIFTDGILHDNASCLESGGLKDPTFPIITNLASHPITSGVSQVMLSRSSAILDFPLLLMGWDIIGRSSPLYSFVDKDFNGYFNGEKDYWGLTSELNFSLMGIGISITPKIELAGGDDGLPVFAATELASGSRAFVSADTSLFNNQLIYEYDNLQLAQNVINWLTGGNHDMVFVFDESHNIPRGTREFSSAAMFGLIQGYINWLSTNPFIAWIYPLWALRTLKKYIPKEQEKKKKKKKEETEAEKQEEELKFRTSSFFAQKINWIRINKEYNQALVLLYRRIDRKINALMGNIDPTVENIVAKLEADRGKYITKDTLKRMTTFLDKMKEIKSNDYQVEDVDEFNDLFFEMNWFNDNL